MKRAQRRLAWLVLGVAVLAALAFWQWRSDRAQATLLPLAPASITRIDIAWLGKPARHFVKRDGHWYRDGQPADDARLAHMATLAATPVLEWRKLADMHVRKIGLDMPAVVVTLDGHALAYGALAAFGPQRYVRVGDRVAIIPASYSPRAPDSNKQPDSSNPLPAGNLE